MPDTSPTCPTRAQLERDITLAARADWWTWYDLRVQLAQHVAGCERCKKEHDAFINNNVITEVKNERLE